MDTFHDVLRWPVIVDPGLEHDEMLPTQWPLKLLAPTATGAKVPLPRTRLGFEGVWAASGMPRSTGDFGLHCKLALTCQPSFALPLKVASDQELAARGIAKNRSSESFQRFLLAASLVLPSGNTIFGWATVTIHLNCLGMGQHKIVEFETQWADDQDALLMALAQLLPQVQVHVAAAPPKGAKPWKTVVLFLAQDLLNKPANWDRHLELLAALMGLKLGITLKADDVQPMALKTLRQSPPDALIVSTHQLRHALLFRQTYERSRPGAPVAEFELGVSAPWESVTNELVVHLLLLSDEADGDVSHSALDWTQAQGIILELESNHFILSDRAKKTLPHCTYPNPDRMLKHVEQLAGLAKHYASGGGLLGERISDIGIREFEIEIALRDKKFKARDIYVHGQHVEGLSAEPHVKVDDVKSADKCGRIYFAIDSEGLAFVVDHIGLHDYY